MSLLALIAEIRAQTELANSLVDSQQIEQCNELIKKRQQLIEKLVSDYRKDSTELLISQEELVNLLHWIKSQDAVSVNKLSAKKASAKTQFIKQNRTKSALKAYTNNQS